MAKDLPEEWTNGTLNTLYLVRDLGLKKSGVPADLRVKRKKGKTTSVLYAEYLPSETDDPRPHAGRTRDGKGRRKPVSPPRALKTPSTRAERRLTGSWRINARQGQRNTKRRSKSSSPLGPTGNAGSPGRAESGREPEVRCAGKGMSP